MQSFEQAKICTRCREEKPHSDFWPRHTRGGGPSSRCKTCSRDAAKEWRRNNPNYGKDRYEKTKEYTREKHLKRKYGISLLDYAAMLDKQSGACAICSKPEAEEKHGVLHVDHCHSTKKVRGLLCNNCNQVLGRAKDKPEILISAAKYLVPQIPEMIGRAIMEAEHDRQA